MRRIEIALPVLLGVLFVGSSAHAQLSACATIPFEACGGELVGTWSYDSIMCMDPPDPTVMFPGCTGVEMQWDGAVAGTTVFTAEGAYQQEMVQSTGVVMSIPTACLPEGATCEMMAREQGMAVTAGDRCIVVVASAEQDNEQGSFTVDGNSATLVDESDGDIDQGEFCITGDELVVRIVGEAGMTAMVRHQRQH